MSIITSVLSTKVFWLIITFTFCLIFNNPAIALIIGGAIALIFGNPQKAFTSRLSKVLLQAAVVLLGFSMSISVILKVGLASLWITLISISMTFILGLLLGKLFGVEKNLTVLITSGTAICGGSAIAAVAPAIGAKANETALAMAVVFLLNAVGLIVFPILGHFLNMSEADFGLWSALAIHDTSSVVGAAAAYGSLALAIATTVKLTRALWIFPVAFVAGRLNKSEGKPKFQWFLIGFLCAGIIRSLLPQFEITWNWIAISGKHLMVGTLFLIGAALTREDLRKIGVKVLVVAVILWIIVSIISLFLIQTGFWSIPESIFK